MAASGSVLVTGTFTATELLSFESYGPSPILPPTLNSGQALIGVKLVPNGSTTSIDAILRIECTLPGGTFRAAKRKGSTSSCGESPTSTTRSAVPRSSSASD